MYRNLFRPAAYHGYRRSGQHRAGPYFEGWYFKLVDAAGAHRFAVIPGIFLDPAGRDSHAFVQTLDGVRGDTSYQRYPLDQFAAHPTEFRLRVGPNHFSLTEIALNLDGDGRRMAGTMRFDDVADWPVTWRSPGIMGWYAYVPFMECYHGVLGFDPTLRGLLAVDGRPIDFHGGRGYIEKDWGEAFPRAYIWMQSNHFTQPGVCLTASIARIPWLGTAFRGFIVGLWLQGRLYRFATYTGAAVERLAVAGETVSLHMRGPDTVNPGSPPLRLEIVAHRDPAHADPLHAPNRTAMLQRALESLGARIDVRLLAADGSTRFADSGRYAGLEFGGDLNELTE
jgi:hypothetical protein